MAATLVAPVAPAPLHDDDVTRRPGLGAVPVRWRAALALVGVGVGVAVGMATTPHGPGGLAALTMGAALLTAVAANWSTCGLSVASVIAAPKQAERPGVSTPLRRLGWHGLGSTTTGALTGAALGAVGWLTVARLPLGMLATGWLTLGLLYGLHELGALRMPTPMRRVQLPRQWRRVMPPRQVAFRFGLIIGPGFLIFIRSSAYYLLVVGVLAVGSPRLGAALFVAVALGRCGPSLAAIVQTRLLGRSMDDVLTAALRVDRAVQVATGAGLLVLAVAGAVGSGVAG